MYTSGSNEFNQMIESVNSSALHHRIVFLDDDTEIVKINKAKGYISSNKSSELQIGTTNMAYMEIEVLTDKLLTNREFRFESGVKLADGTIEYAPIGYFTIQKPDGDLDYQKFTAYDRMQKFEKMYSSALSNPTNTALIVNEICAMCGVELATPIDEPIPIEKNLQGYTCREVLGYVSALHGKFACIDRFGKLNIRWYSEIPIDKEISLIWSFTKSQKDFSVDKIEISKDGETNFTSGSGFGVIYHSNPLATQEITDNIFNKLNGFTYNASVIQMLDDIRLDPWDIIKVTYLDGEDYLVPCMFIEQNFTDGSTLIESYAKSDTENEYRFTGPTINYLNRMATELLLANRVIATKVDAEYVNSHAITTENFDAKVAEITELVVESIDGKYATLDLANIDVANINKAKIGLLFAEVGLIDRATIVDGHITGFLDAVEVNANKITAGTLVADRILLSGEEGSVLFALNNLGELVSTNVDTLDGYILTDRTITADKIIANSITSNEIDVAQLFADEAAIRTLIAQSIFTDAIETNRVVVGASNTANEALDKVKKTVKSITMHYLATTASSGVTTSTSGWTTTVQNIDATKKYLWTYQTMTYADGTSTNTSPVISGVYGNTGANGSNGSNGADGKGISKIVEYYQVSTSNTATPTTWVTTVPTMTEINKYLWNYESITYTDNTTTDTLKRVIGVYGDKGATGSAGTNGSDGKGISNIVNYYLASASASGVTTSTSGWTTTVQTITTSNKYLWNYEVITYTDNSTTTTTPVIIGAYGNTGANGATGTGITSVTPLYYLKSNTTAPTAPTSAVTSTSTSSGVWTKSMPSYVSGYTYFTCTQTQYTNGTYGWSTVVADNALTNANASAESIKANVYYTGTTLIDGNKIYTGSITADAIAADAIKSKNYVEDISGSFLNLTDGSFDSKHLKWDKYGNATITDLNVLNSLNFGSGVYSDYITRPVQYYLRAQKYTGGYMSDIIKIGYETWDNVDNPTTLVDDTVIMSVYGGYQYGVEFPIAVYAKKMGVYNLQPYEERDKETGSVLSRNGSIGTNSERFPKAYIEDVVCNNINVDGYYQSGQGNINAQGYIGARGDVYAGYGTTEQVSLKSVGAKVNNLINRGYSLLRPADIGELTTTEKTYATFNNRKISDYDIINFSIGASDNDVRATMTVPRTIFDGTNDEGLIRTFYIDCWSNSGQNFHHVCVRYVSDTQIKAWMSYQNSATKILNVYGIKIIDRREI